MDISPHARERLASLMDDRRIDLRLTWRQVAERAGLSYEAVRALRAGDEGNPDRLTMRKVDGALEWEPGTIEATLSGSPLPADAEAILAELERILPTLGLSEKQLQAFNRLPDAMKIAAYELGMAMKRADTNGDAEHRSA